MSSDFQVHWYQPGDEDAWVAIHKHADRFNPITPELYVQQFTHDSLQLPERQCYLLDKAGRAVATATAWAKQSGVYAGFGQLHWVAVVPDLHNQGVGRMIVTLACQRLLALGHTQAMLLTDTLRPAAIHLYEKFGFRITDQQSSGPQPH